ncbi:hypothetical protein X797_009020 [Metarhizium robertsii]|uniref:Secreted protein n=1 Tax=Metarhizium robertsii TaxID=568076 RepID=A0A014PM47_9HYPO|nr:hypothetical protein X797_009020 [Metarhizium robertsii]
MWAVFRRLKSWSLTNVTAWGAVAKAVAFEETKGKSRGAVVGRETVAGNVSLNPTDGTKVHECRQQQAGSEQQHCHSIALVYAVVVATLADGR